MTETRFQTKAEWVYARLRDMIVGGQLQPGQPLRLTHLANELQTSEMPVREALRMLQRDGLVEIQSHRGATVTDVSWKRVYEIVLVRMHLEVLAAGEAAGRHSPESAAAIETLLQTMDGQMDMGDGTGFSSANRQFHMLLYEPCRYELLKEEITELWDKMWRLRSNSLFTIDPDRMKVAQEEHWALFHAVRDNSPQVTDLAERHRANTLAAWQRIVERETEFPTL